MKLYFLKTLSFVIMIKFVGLVLTTGGTIDSLENLKNLADLDSIDLIENGYFGEPTRSR